MEKTKINRFFFSLFEINNLYLRGTISLYGSSNLQHDALEVRSHPLITLKIDCLIDIFFFFFRIIS
jgi:hypothetical protein